MSRIGVIGPVVPDYVAKNMGYAMQRLGHVVTHPGPAHRRCCSRLVDRAGAVGCQTLGETAARAVPTDRYIAREEKARIPQCLACADCAAQIVATLL